LHTISQESTILYATHLSQLLDPRKIPMKDCRICDRDGWKITLQKHGDFKYKNNLGALTTLNNALKLSLSGFIHPEPSKPFVITEGITDFYMFSMVKEYTDIFGDLDFYLIPGAGVDQLD